MAAAAGADDEAGIGDEGFEFLMEDIGGFVGAAGDEDGLAAQDLFGGGGGEREGFSGSGRALADAEGEGIDGVEEIELGGGEEGGDGFGIAAVGGVGAFGVGFSKEGLEWGREAFLVHLGELIELLEESGGVVGAIDKDEGGGGKDGGCFALGGVLDGF